MPHMGGLALESKRAGFINARFEHDARFKVLIDDLRAFAACAEKPNNK